MKTLSQLDIAIVPARKDIYHKIALCLDAMREHNNRLVWFVNANINYPNEIFSILEMQLRIKEQQQQL
jgi:hypothetical protein